MNKETIDEVAERLFNQVKGGITSVSAFKKGAKWERENSNLDVLEFEIATLKSLITDMDATIKSKYGEEEVWNMCNELASYFIGGDTFDLKGWFKQFEKK
jgi:DNA-binding ferritin-like protein